MTRRGATAASEAAGSPLRPLAGGGTLRGAGEGGRAPSHWGEAGSSPATSRGEQAGRRGEEEEGTGTRADAAGPSAAPEVPAGGSPSSASPA